MMVHRTIAAAVGEDPKDVLELTARFVVGMLTLARYDCCDIDEDWFCDVVKSILRKLRERRRPEC